MDFDVRYLDYTFKHTTAPKPDLKAARYQPHFHTSYELLYFVRGDADFMIESKLYKLKPGSLLIIKPGEYHNTVFRSEAPYERYVIRFMPQSIYSRLQKLLPKTKSVYYIEGTPLAAEFHRMDVHLNAVHDDVRVGACLGSLQIIIAYLVSSQGLIQSADYVNEQSRTIEKYVESHLSEIHCAEDIARALHMSKSTLYKTFSAQFQTPLMSYIRTRKCMAARTMLFEGLPATEVAERLGFAHYSSFYRDYCQVFGAPPTSARETN
ncbi:MAG: AraC family transcriptional regulator [Lachnospiraceae bacterium]|nr:AraC family transcriptional regulator [Lachnospiraceae bacterium]